MPVCSHKDWTIDIKAGDGSVLARPVFTKITISGKDIKGEVHLPIGTKISDLRGVCDPLANPDIAAVNFRFRLKDSASEIGILASGIGFIPTGGEDAEFRGVWIAHRPGADTPAAIKVISLVLPGEGDTGTGSGSQT